MRGPASVSVKWLVSSVTVRKSLSHSGLEYSSLQVVGFGGGNLSCSFLLSSSDAMVSGAEAGAGVAELWRLPLFFFCLMCLPPPKRAVVSSICASSCTALCFGGLKKPPKESLSQASPGPCGVRAWLAGALPLHRLLMFWCDMASCSPTSFTTCPWALHSVSGVGYHCFDNFPGCFLPGSLKQIQEIVFTAIRVSASCFLLSL